MQHLSTELQWCLRAHARYPYAALAAPAHHNAVLLGGQFDHFDRLRPMVFFEASTMNIAYRL